MEGILHGEELMLSSFGTAALQRCSQHRLRLLEISRNVSALHLAGSFSSIEIMDTVYYGAKGEEDVFLLSKGHAGVGQYVILESLKVISHELMDSYGHPASILSVHPTKDIPGIYFGTGSLGHGLGIGLGAALKRKAEGKQGHFFVLISDGELQEGSTWEIIINAPALSIENLTIIVDFNDFQSLGRTSATHPNLLPLSRPLSSLGWKVIDVDGHSSESLLQALINAKVEKCPVAIIAHTTKGKGVSYMENVPIWHYRSPSLEEYQKAILELKDGTSA